MSDKLIVCLLVFYGVILLFSIKEGNWARVVKGRTLTKQERSDIVTGYLAMKKLGVYDKSAIDTNRKLLDNHW